MICELVGDNVICESDRELHERCGKVKGLLKQYKESYEKIAIVSHWWTLTYLNNEGDFENARPFWTSLNRLLHVKWSSVSVYLHLIIWLSSFLMASSKSSSWVFSHLLPTELNLRKPDKELVKKSWRSSGSTVRVILWCCFETLREVGWDRTLRSFEGWLSAI